MRAQAGRVIDRFRRSGLIQPFLQPFERDEVVRGTWEGRNHKEKQARTRQLIHDTADGIF